MRRQINLTPERLAAAYDYLCTTPPFHAWKLPPSDEVEFHVTRHRDREGDHCAYQYRPDHVIRVSAYYIKATNPLMMVLGHEMIHLHQEMRKLARPGQHNQDWRRKAVRVCRIHGWEFKTFTGDL